MTQRQQSGFTLVEMLVSLLVVGAVVATLATVLTTGLRVAQGQEKVLGSADRDLMLSAMLAHRLDRVVLASDGRSVVFEVTQDRLSFVSELPEASPAPGPHLVTFEAAPNADGMALWVSVAEWDRGRVGPVIDRVLMAEAQAFAFGASDPGPGAGLPRNVTLSVISGGTKRVLRFDLPAHLPLACLVAFDMASHGLTGCPEALR